MRKIIRCIFILTFVCFCGFECVAQNNTEKSLEYRASYVSPIRYVIVYNDLWNPSGEPGREERRIEALLDANQFNEENLIKIFDYIRKQFPDPVRLTVNVHTSLETIETPEERDMAAMSSVGRLTHNSAKHKDASYGRYPNGREAFIYKLMLRKNFVDLET